MPAFAAPEARAVRFWLIALIALVLLMVLVGGATRLTGSGLSITEWRPVTGAIPPLSAAEWLAEFEKYRKISQYELVNRGMSLSEFQVIYAWEWGHRQLGRLIGVVYLAGFICFALRGAFNTLRLTYFFTVGLLLGTQGLVGWIMVASGLEPGMTAVAPLKLALHLTLATLFFGALVHALRRPTLGLGSAAADAGTAAGLRRVSWLVVSLILAQIALGGLVAGAKAGLTYNTWPLMDGRFFPTLEELFIVSPWFENLVDNPLTVQFDHRMLAYFVVWLAVLQAVLAARQAPGSALSRRTFWLAALAIGQGALGIVTLLLAVPLWAGLLHQGLAMVLFGLALWHAGTPRDHRSC